MAHEVATRELQLETLVDECNKKKQERKIARARGRGSTINQDNVGWGTIAEALGAKKGLHLDEKTLQAIAEPHAEANWEKPKKPAK